MEVTAGTPVVRFNFDVPPDHTLYAGKLRFETESGEALTPFVITEPLLHRDPVSGQEKPVYEGPFIAKLKLATPLPANLIVKLQGCSNSACYFPERRFFSVTSAGVVAQADVSANATTNAASPIRAAGNWLASASEFKVAARETGYLPKKRFLSFLDEGKAGRRISGGGLTRFHELGLPMTLLLIVLGGLGLNLTPCVLPMIPINLAIIGAGAQASSRRRGFALGGVYGAGMALVYGALGLVVVLTGSKFGTLNSSGWFNLGIALVFVVMTLAMFDLVNVDFSRFQGRVGTTGVAQKSQFVLAFSIGVVAALLAGACVAPVVISVLLLATQLYGEGKVVALLLPFLLGLGMALPWPFAGAGLSFLPQPGAWMKLVKHVFGGLILLFALYYGHLAGSLFLSHHQLAVSARTASEANTRTSDPNEALAEALQQARLQGRPVFIDFAASWCKNCAAMEATVFNAPEVLRQFQDFVVFKYQAEQPNESPAKEVLDHFGVIGLPTYVVLLPDH